MIGNCLISVDLRIEFISVEERFDLFACSFKRIGLERGTV